MVTELLSEICAISDICVGFWNTPMPILSYARSE